jgi:hypothetical protein
VKHTTALAALVIAAVSLASLPVVAQETTPTANRGDREVHRTFIREDGGARGGAGILALVCSPRGAEALEVAFVRLSHRLDLTDTQQPLFDALKSKALTTQTGFADDCTAALPDRTAAEKPDMLERFKAGLAIEEARLAALTAVLPDFEAFYASLTDEQKTSLQPRRMMRDRGMDDRGPRPDRDAPGRMQRLPAPGR